MGNRKTIAITIIFLVSFGVYFNALYNGFVFDDRFQILENRWISDTKYISEIFTNNVWNFDKQQQPSNSNYYRPLMHIIFMMDYQLFGLKPWGFHLVNILFHTGVSILVFLVLLQLLVREPQPLPTQYHVSAAFFAAMLFAAHPIHTEAVTWISAVTDVSSTFFSLLSLYLYIRSEDGERGIYLLSVIAFALATLCKEPALTLPLILISYDSLFRKPRRLNLKKYIPYLAVSVVYLALRLHALRGLVPVRPSVDLTPYEYIINVFPLFCQYLEKLLFPANLSFWRDFHPIKSLLLAKGAVPLTISLAYMGIVWLAYKRNKTVCFGLILIVIPLLPALYIKAISAAPFSERYLYFPSVGFVILAAYGLSWTRYHIPKISTVLIAACLAVICLYSVGTLRRNTDWKNNNSLYADTLNKSHSSAFGLIAVTDTIYNANASLEKGQIDEAIDGFRFAETLRPNYIDIYNKLGIAYMKKGLTDLAIDQFRKAADLKPYLFDAHNNLGNAYLVRGWRGKAIEEYQTALKLNPNSVECHYNLALAYKEEGLIGETIEHLQAALSLDPSNAALRAELAATLGRKPR